MSNKDRYFYIAGYDISKYVLSYSNIASEQSKPEWGELPALQRTEFTMINTTGAFSSFNPLSIFSNQKYTDMRVLIKLKMGGVEYIEYDGFIEDAIENYGDGTTKVVGISPFIKALDSPCLTATGSATPSELSRQLFALFNIPYDNTSYGAANAYHSGLITCIFDPNLFDSNITLLETQKQLATAGFGRIYSYNGKMFYEVNQTIIPTISYNLTDKDIMGSPSINAQEREKKYYNVKYIDGDVNSAGFIAGVATQGLDFGPNSSVKITSLTGAQACADAWERISKINQRQIVFPVKHSVGICFELGTFLTLTWAKGGFFNTILEVIGINRTDTKYTMLTCRGDI